VLVEYVLEADIQAMSTGLVEPEARAEVRDVVVAVLLICETRNFGRGLADVLDSEAQAERQVLRIVRKREFLVAPRAAGDLGSGSVLFLAVVEVDHERQRSRDWTPKRELGALHF